MIGGLRETASVLAIAALCCVGAAALAAKPAKAADLGGDCCADLEERVAELEATTARKGNKKVSVQIYGKVNRAVMFWDDGGEQNVYSVDNYNESSRTGIKGNAKISDDWSAGYRLEWEYRMAASSRVNQFEAKAGFQIASDYYGLDADAGPDTKGVAPGEVVDLTARLQPDGRLDWTPPAGRWRGGNCTVSVSPFFSGTWNSVPCPGTRTGRTDASPSTSPASLRMITCRGGACSRRAWISRSRCSRRIQPNPKVRTNTAVTTASQIRR